MHSEDKKWLEQISILDMADILVSHDEKKFSYEM